jgi:sigma-B regulation protein RsbU (phosphoserine phosphatase)
VEPTKSNLLSFAAEWFGRPGLAFAILAIAWLLTSEPAVLLAAALAAFWLAIRILRRLMRTAVWRLRNRLLVAYLFIAVVPIALILALAALASYTLVSQLAVYLVTSELDRRIEALEDAAHSIVEYSPERMAELAPRLAEVVGHGSDTGLEILGRARHAVFRYPESSSLPNPPDGWQSARGVLIRDAHPYLWSYSKTASGSLTVTLPLTRELLESLIPGLGVIDFGAAEGGSRARAEAANAGAHAVPPPMFSLDREVLWFATLPVAEWNAPGKLSERYVLAVRTRVSAVLATIFNRRGDVAQSVLVTLMLAGVAIFVVVEIASLMLGAALTRTITGAVHLLYEGTQKVAQGDFSHRITITGTDQLAELGHSFNRMTANIQRLLAVAKEKERLQSEIEIAREVQQQLFPKQTPPSASLAITAACKPARTVSGDYYDYAVLNDGRIVLALGDVAGKGISAALLMAALQSSLRAQVQSAEESHAEMSPATLLQRINRQLFAATSPEKYATLWLGIYHPATGALGYANAGHLPPVLIRDGHAIRMDVNGTVVGAFPQAEYSESRIVLQPGDLIGAFTDGATEAENSYGEMLGEARLIDMLCRLAGRSGGEIVQSVEQGIHEWTGASELQDDLTLLLARRI